MAVALVGAVIMCASFTACVAVQFCSPGLKPGRPGMPFCIKPKSWQTSFRAGSYSEAWNESKCVKHSLQHAHCLASLRHSLTFSVRAWLSCCSSARAVSVGAQAAQPAPPLGARPVQVRRRYPLVTVQGPKSCRSHRMRPLPHPLSNPGMSLRPMVTWKV